MCVRTTGSSLVSEKRQNTAPGSPEVRVWGGESPETLKRRRREGGPLSSRLRRKPGRIALRQCALPACLPASQSEDGDFFPFIHVPFSPPPPPPPLKQASRSVTALRALGRVKPVGF
ncbi:hypothetical protein XENORESO_015234 [Xenotaenia resolanae]|uniref:Uncharacterized protein n=1 Tax=Xenotaenia resolanae TaxID=208358 RepID=A0ABV0W2Z8_9TELE